MISTHLVRYIFTAAFRDKLLIAFALMLVLSVCLSLFMASAAIIEQSQFSLVFIGSSLRIVLVMALVLFVVFHMRRSFDSKDVEFLLSRPIGRVQFILSHGLAFSILAIGLTILTAPIFYAISPQNFDLGDTLWVFSVMAEAMIMVNVALFFAMVIASPVGASMAVMAFYVLCRMMGQILGIIDGSKTDLMKGLEYLMEAISAVLPRLDLMGQTSWLLYGLDDGPAFGFVLVQGAVFILILLSASLIDLTRRQF